uniref:Uncharacterized protein n=1 Tax=Moniliophthora roreri TaxID=221103 RepID=A0A0W0FE23_MONRR
MSSHKSSFLQPLHEASPAELNQCRYSYPLAPLVTVRNAEAYLREHPANHIPPDYEVPFLKEALQTTLAELNLLDGEFWRVWQMNERRRRLMEIKFRLDGMIKTTIRRLPPELLSHIFFMAQDEGNQGWSSCRLPLTLSHVCGRWRALVHSEPGLWCTINASFRDEDDQLSADRLLEFTKFCLEKSKSLPINVTLTTPEHSNNPGSGSQSGKAKLHADVLNELLANTSRWRVANLLLQPDDEERFIEHDMDFPILERLDMCFQQDGQNSACNTATTRTYSAPRLSRMNLRNVDYGRFRLINLDALTEFTMESFHIASLVHILQHARNLCSVKLMGELCLCPRVRNLSVISSMKSFEVALELGALDLFRYLTLPSLTILQVRCPANQMLFSEFISHSRPPLTHLVLPVNMLSHVAGMNALALLPTITHLRLEEKYLMRNEVSVANFSRGMTVGPESTHNVLLPNLTHLDLRFHDLKQGNVGALMAVLESRCFVAHGLRQRLVALRLSLGYKHRSALVKKRINALRANGLDVRVELF